jgi:hypothetical protein
MEAISNLAAGGRRASLGDSLGAAVGGVAGALALPFGPAKAGAVQGAVASAAQDYLNGAPVSAERAGEGALLGHLFGGLAGIGGRKISNDLPMKAKGRLGEFLGEARSTMNGRRRRFDPKGRDHDESKTDYWYPDGTSGDVRFEDKFGSGAKLSPNQARAQGRLGPNFWLNSFVPSDVGKAAGVPAAATGRQISSRRSGR